MWIGPAFIPSQATYSIKKARQIQMSRFTLDFNAMARDGMEESYQVANALSVDDLTKLKAVEDLVADAVEVVSYLSFNLIIVLT